MLHSVSFRASDCNHVQSTSILQERAAEYCHVREGSKPKKDPMELMKEAFRLLQEFEELVVRINHTNNTAQVSSGKTLPAVMSARDRLRRQHGFLEHPVSQGQDSRD